MRSAIFYRSYILYTSFYAQCRRYCFNIPLTCYACVYSHGISHIVFRSEYVDSLVLFEDREAETAFMVPLPAILFALYEEPHVPREKLTSPLISLSLKASVEVLSR